MDWNNRTFTGRVVDKDYINAYNLIFIKVKVSNILPHTPSNVKNLKGFDFYSWSFTSAENVNFFFFLKGLLLLKNIRKCYEYQLIEEKALNLRNFDLSLWGPENTENRILYKN